MNRAVPLAALILACAPLAARAQEPLPPPAPAAPQAPPPAASPAESPEPAATAPAPAATPAPAAPPSSPAPETGEPLPPAPPPARPGHATRRPWPRLLAPRPGPEPSEQPARIEGPPRLDYLRLGVGPRFMYVPSAGFDTFAKSDLLTSFAVDATITVLQEGKLTLATGLAWDVGGRSDGLRGVDASLTVHRLTVPIEGRWHYKPWLYSFLKIAPGTAYMRDRIDDKANPTIHDAAWVFAAEASVGASLLALGHGDLDRRSVRLWVTPEIGYSLATSADLRPDPGRDDKDVLGADASANLGSLGLSGLFWRISAAVTF
jgi:hypothetical protein